MSFIFISYSREDQVYVEMLVEVFQEQNLPCWLDEQIEHGEVGWNRMIERRLEKCGAFLVVMTPSSRESLWVQNELSRAIELRKPIFPILLAGNRWLDVASIQAADVTNGNLPPDRFFKRLQASLNSPSGRPSANSNVTPPSGCGLHLTRLLFAYLIALGLAGGILVYALLLSEISSFLPSSLSKVIEERFSILLSLMAVAFLVAGGVVGYRLAKILSRFFFYKN